jgi:hypothetical protein
VRRLALLLAAGCTVWRPAPVPRGDDIKVPHARHAAAKVDCIVCHEEIYDQKSLAARALPPEAKCLECHRDKKESGQCDFCHTDVSRARAWPQAEPTLRMDHAAHIERTHEKCETCHRALPDPVRTVGMAPPMAACLGCHEHRREFDEARCQGCHLDLQRHALAPASFFSHAPGFVREHGRSARAAADACAQCHEQTFCAECHAQTTALPIEFRLPERVDRDFIHRHDFLGRHSVEAAGDPASCRRCHGQSFCDSCHQRQNLTPLGANPRDPHPPGWSFPGSPNFHGREARRDIVRCAACHDQGARSICVDCHKVGGIGGNPHPPGWGHSRGEIAGNGMCLICHL